MTMVLMVSPREHTFLEIDRLFTLKTGLLTAFGLALTLLSGLIPFTALPLDGSLGFEIVPYRPTLVLLFVVFFAAATGNLASALLLGLAGGIAIVSPIGVSQDVIFPEGNLILMLMAAIIAGYLGNSAFREKVFGSLFFVLILAQGFLFLFLSLAFNGHVEKYTDQGISVGHGGPFLGFDFPVFEITYISIIVLFSLLFFWLFVIRDITLISEESKQWNLIGIITIAIGGILGVVSAAAFVASFGQSTLNAITENDSSNLAIRDLLYHNDPAKYAVIVSPWNGIFALSAVFLLLLLGSWFRSLAIGDGNQRTIKLGTVAAYATIPFVFTIFTVLFLPDVASFLNYNDVFVLFYDLLPVYIAAWLGITGITTLLMLLVEIIVWMITEK